MSEQRGDAEDCDEDDVEIEDRIEHGVEHLQAAAHEMLAAARSFLDVVEDVVSDRDKLNDVAGSVTDLLGSAGSSLARLAGRVGGAPATDPGDRSSASPRPRVRRIDVD